MNEHIQVITTAGSAAEARRIASALVSRRLAACVQIVGPVTSTYWWRSKMEESEEWQCWAKTRRELFARVEQAIREVHSYEVPEVLAVPVLAGSQAYLDWLDQETTHPC